MVPADRLAQMLDRLPPDWPVVPVKYVCSINRWSLTESTDDDFTFRYIDIGGVDSLGKWTASEHMRFEDAPSRARRLVSAGDVLIATVRTYLRAVALVSEVSEPLVASTGFAILTPGPRVYSSYLGYWTRSDGFIDEMVARSTGVSYPAINPDDIGNLPFPSIDTDQQEAIAAFLDRETSRIDSIIQLKQRQIELLEEKRVALITQAVTKGLDRKVKMKDSGVEWLGEIPEHWSVVPLRWHCSIGSGSFILNTHFAQQPSPENPIPVIGGNGVMGFGQDANISNTVIVIGRVGAQCGNVHLVEPPAWVTDNALILRSASFDPQYLTLVLGAMNLNSLANQNAQPLVSGSTIKDQAVPMPPRAEQSLVTMESERSALHLQNLQELILRSVDLLAEYRSSLISAAVTGQIDVRGEVLAP